MTDSQEFAPSPAPVIQAARAASPAATLSQVTLPQAARAAVVGVRAGAVAAQGMIPKDAYGPIANTDPGAFTKAAGWMGLVGLAPMGMMAWPFINGGARIAGNAIHGVGKITGWEGLRDFGAARAENANNRAERFHNWRTTTIGERFPGLKTSPALTSASQHLSGLMQGVGLGSDARIMRLEQARDTLLEKVGPDAARFGDLLARAEPHLTSKHATLFGQVKDASENLRTAASNRNMAAVDEARVALAKGIGRLHQAVHSLEKSPFDNNLSAEMLRPAGVWARAKRMISNTVPVLENDKAATSRLRSEFELLNHHASKAAITESKKSFWHSIGKGTSGNFIGRRLGEMDTMHTAIYAAAGLSNIAMHVHSVHSFRAQYNQFKAIYKGLTGQPFSLWKAIDGEIKIPPVLKKSYEELFFGALREGGLNTALTGLDIALFFTKHGGQLAMAAQMAATQVQDAFKCEVPLVQMEQAMAGAQAKGTKLEAVHYAQLLQLAAPETIGKVKSTNSMFVRLCNHLAANQWSALNVLKAVNDHSIDALATQIQQEMAAQGRQPKETLEKAVAPQTAQIPAAANTNFPAANQNHITPMKAVVNGMPGPTMRIQPAHAVHTPPALTMLVR